MRVACVLITHLRAKAEMRRQADLKDRSTLVVEGVLELTRSTAP